MVDIQETKEYASEMLNNVKDKISNTVTNSNVLQPTESYIYEYNNNVRPSTKAVPIAELPAQLHYLDVESQKSTADIPWDLSMYQNKDIQNTKFTCPNLLCGYLRILPNDNITQSVNASSLSMFVIRGSGYSVLDDNTRVEWQAGDLFVIPAQTKPITHYASDDSKNSEHIGCAMYYVHDSPLLEYLSVKASGRRFQSTLFKRHSLRNSVNEIEKDPDSRSKNRLGILLGNQDTPHTLTITHTLWALFNKIPARSVQRPHRHNAVALDLAVEVHPDSIGKVYTLVGNEIDSNGNIVNPQKVLWKPGQAFTTPLGLWHQHQNDSDHEAWVLPMQDAGLALHLGAYDIRFAEEEKEHVKQGKTLTGVRGYDEFPTVNTE